MPGKSGPLGNGFGVDGFGRHGVERGSPLGGLRVAGFGLLTGLGRGRARHGSRFKKACLVAIF